MTLIGYNTFKVIIIKDEFFRNVCIYRIFMILLNSEIKCNIEVIFTTENLLAIFLRKKLILYKQ